MGSQWRNQVFQKWFQSSCVKFALLSGIGFLGFGSPLVEGSTSTRIPRLLQEVEKKYAQAQTLSADFSQSNLNQLLGKRNLSSGILRVKRPSKVRWETKAPSPNLLIGNGKVYWFYTPPFFGEESGQVIEKPAAEVQSQLADALLSGAFSLAQAKAISQKDSHTFQFVPSAGTAGSVAKAWISIDPQKKLIKKVTLFHQGGNQSEIVLSNIELGVALSDELFKFTAPPQTDRVNPSSNAP